MNVSPATAPHRFGRGNLGRRPRKEEENVPVPAEEMDSLYLEASFVSSDEVEGAVPVSPLHLAPIVSRTQKETVQRSRGHE